MRSNAATSLCISFHVSVCVNFNHLCIIKNLIGRCCTKQLCPKSPRTPWYRLINTLCTVLYNTVPVHARVVRRRLLARSTHSLRGSSIPKLPRAGSSPDRTNRRRSPADPPSLSLLSVCGLTTSIDSQLPLL